MAALRLRVFPDNPAQRLYSRLGFQVVASDNGIVHMVHPVPPNQSLQPTPKAFASGHAGQRDDQS
jgi:hypothetical protein